MSAIHGKRFLYVFLASVFFCIGFVPKKVSAVTTVPVSVEVMCVGKSPFIAMDIDVTIQDDGSFEGDGSYPDQNTGDQRYTRLEGSWSQEFKEIFLVVEYHMNSSRSNASLFHVDLIEEGKNFDWTGQLYAEFDDSHSSAPESCRRGMRISPRQQVVEPERPVPPSPNPTPPPVEVPVVQPTVTSKDCHWYDNSKSVRDGYGAAYNVFSNEKESLISAKCTDGNVNILIGNGKSNTYVHEDAYVLRNGKLNLFKLSGEIKKDGWIIGSANYTLELNPYEIDIGTPLFVNICIKDGSSFKCGCKDATCAKRYWNLQRIKDLSTPDYRSLYSIVNATSDDAYYRSFFGVNNPNSVLKGKSIFSRISNLQNGALGLDDSWKSDNWVLKKSQHSKTDGLSENSDGEKVISYFYDGVWEDELNFDTSFNTVYARSPAKNSEGKFEVISAIDEFGAILDTTNTNSYYFSYDSLNDGIGSAITLRQWVDYLEKISNTYGRIDILSITAHGSSGFIKMSDSFKLTTNDIQNNENVKNELWRLRNILNEGASILLFSCQVARGKTPINPHNTGHIFVQELANLTGATIYANKWYTGDDLHSSNFLVNSTINMFRTWSLDSVSAPD